MSTRCVFCRILPSNALMRSMSGVLESSRQDLSIRRMISLMGRLLITGLLSRQQLEIRLRIQDFTS
eukprot:scaffold15273_cov83-Skeletonema_marinoi.AAC.6